MRTNKWLFLLLLALPSSVIAQSDIGPYDIVLDEKIGDLDRDGMEERAMVVNMLDSAGHWKLRELRILKRQGRGWIIWHRSVKAILQPEEGGAMGDPFEYIEIDKGILTVRQSGGNSWKWGQTDKYRYQRGRFELVGYTSFYGKPCEYWADFDYNISARKVTYKKEYETCALHKQQKPKKQSEHFRYRMKHTLTLETRYDHNTTIKCPRLKQEIVF